MVPRGGVLVVQRSAEERAANPDRINLDRCQLAVSCPSVSGVMAEAMPFGGARRGELMGLESDYTGRTGR